jgi:coiled-coil domain-containing protein 12
MKTSVTLLEGPKKVNWDLKRDVEKKMQKLEKRTQRAILDLLRERLQRQAEEEEVAVDSHGGSGQVSDLNLD